MASLNDRLSQLASRNAQGVGSDKSIDSNDAIVVGVDKTTGDYLVRKNGAVSTAKSVGNSGIKLGVSHPVVDGKILNPERPPTKKVLLSVPVSAKSQVENSFYIAYLPVPITGSSLSGYSRLNGIGDYRTSAYNVAEYHGVIYENHKIGTLGPSLNSYIPHAPFESPPGTVPTDLYLGWEECSAIGSAPNQVGVIDMRKSVAYKLLKSVIDFVFPAAEGDTKRSDQVLTPNTRWTFGTWTREEKEFLLRGIQRPLSAGENGEMFDQFDIVCISLSESWSFPFNLKQLIKRKFAGIKNGSLKKVLIVIHSGSLIPYDAYPMLRGCRPTTVKTAGFGLAIEAMGAKSAELEYFRAGWLAGVVTEQLLGVTLCGLKTSIGTRGTIGYRGSGAKRALSASSLAGGANAPPYADVSNVSWAERFGHFAFRIVPDNILIKDAGGSQWGGLFWDTYNTGNYITDQKQFAPLLSDLSESVGSTVYFGFNYFFKGLSEVSPIQPIYGDIHTPHCWIKGITEEEIDAIDPVAMAAEFNISKPVQYLYGLDVPPISGAP